MTISVKVRKLVFEKFNQHCAYCGRKILYKELQCDHVVAKSNFIRHIKNKTIPDFLNHLTPYDINHTDNLFPSCRMCNKWKSDFYIEDFRKELSLQTERLNKRTAGYRIAKIYGQLKETEKPIIFYFEKFKGSLQGT